MNSGRFRLMILIGLCFGLVRRTYPRTFDPDQSERDPQASGGSTTGARLVHVATVSDERAFLRHRVIDTGSRVEDSVDPHVRIDLSHTVTESDETFSVVFLLRLQL